MSNEFPDRPPIYHDAWRLAIVASEYNSTYVEGLVKFASDELSLLLPESNFATLRVPGSFEIPLLLFALDALEQRRSVPCRHRIAARAAYAVAQRQFPILLTQFEGHVQLARFYRMLSLKGCSSRIHFALLPLNRVGGTLVLTQGGKSRTALHSISRPEAEVGKRPPIWQSISGSIAPPAAKNSSACCPWR